MEWTVTAVMGASSYRGEADRRAAEGREGGAFHRTTSHQRRASAACPLAWPPDPGLPSRECPVLSAPSARPLAVGLPGAQPLPRMPDIREDQPLHTHPPPPSSPFWAAGHSHPGSAVVRSQGPVPGMGKVRNGTAPCPALPATAAPRGLPGSVFTWPALSSTALEGQWPSAARALSSASP